MFSPAPEAFSNAFPFHLVVDSSFKIIQLGPSLKELCKKLRLGEGLTQHFTLTRPKITMSVESLRSASRATFYLTHNDTGLNFRYQVLPHDSNAIFFVGSPVFNTVESFANHGLKLTHFAPHDVLPDFLLVIEPKDNYLQDIKCLAERLKASRDELVAINELLIEKNAQLEQARQTAEDKSQLLDALNKELKVAQAQLVQSEKLASIGRLAAGINHELNQPIGVIALQAELSLAMAKRGKYEQIEANLANIIKQVDRAAIIMDHLRIFGRDSTDMPREANAINKIIDDSLTMIREHLHVNNIVVTVRQADNLPPVICNAIQIEQVMANLLLNAKDALENVQNKSIEVRSRREQNFIVVEVEDNGCGMTAAVQGKIFDPFFTLKEVGKGTGLGLSICYSILQDHKGQICVCSEEGQGTTFTLKLPS